MEKAEVSREELELVAAEMCKRMDELKAKPKRVLIFCGSLDETNRKYLIGQVQTRMGGGVNVEDHPGMADIRWRENYDGDYLINGLDYDLASVRERRERRAR